MIQKEVINQARDLIAGFVLSRRKELGISQAKLAERAGLNVKTIERLEKKHFAPDFTTLMKLCHALDCYFFFGEKEKDEPVINTMRDRWRREGDQN